MINEDSNGRKTGGECNEKNDVSNGKTNKLLSFSELVVTNLPPCL